MVVCAKKCGSTFEREVWVSQLDGKRGKLGFGVGRRISLMLGDFLAMTSDGSSAYGCTHFPSGAKRCLFWTWHLLPRACVSGALDPSLRLFGRERLLSEVVLGYGFDAPARASRLASGGCRNSGGFAASRIGFGTLNTLTFSNWKPSSASFGDSWTVVSKIVVCFVWSTAESFLD